jgi:hypothetical protein
MASSNLTRWFRWLRWFVPRWRAPVTPTDVVGTSQYVLSQTAARRSNLAEWPELAGGSPSNLPRSTAGRPDNRAGRHYA